ncbi:type II toxin-antitoxin system RelE/ParE family toxin [Lentisphaera profundi]|uniref:Type II toxin-antitoxin system RelE/ParE family toxin n=1 Tax=Lentisphaera profundi TaxID=1658616 RepID=A0ABY7VQR3_9BACT|nr:type II toxin-antitoxin system RelE/ParE family toxin [Lentisphaera profundi]WDE96545.1 type II toxin-antitoxin system RelE/ParE family toxin [Lentisphaera profundi]
MNLYFHPGAQQDLREAINYYNECKVGLGQQFAAQIQKSIQQIQGFPEAWSLISKRTRRVMTNRFPYGLIYSIKNDTIIVLAVMQLNRKPGYWKNRKI